MATADETGPRVAAVHAHLEKYGLDWVHVAFANIFVLSLGTHLYQLGARVAHWDEARVVYWTVRYMETGAVEYRPIIHGPFYHHVNRWVFEAIGLSDFSMRLVVAALGVVFPLSALLLRERLRDVEVVALGLFLTINPVILYYTRFMRGDPLVAMFMFTAFAFFVHAVDTGRRRHVLAGVGLVALAFTAKENALLYVVTWVGATALLLDRRLLLSGEREEDWLSTFLGYVWTAGGLLKRHILLLFASALEFLAIIVFFYAPRAPDGPKTGLWEGIYDPSKFPDVLFASTVGAWQDFWGLWVGGSHQDHPYLPFLGDFLQTFAHGALALGLLAVVGFLADRYSPDGPRDVVAFAFYWGFVSVLGYPIVTDIKAPWATLNAVVPLAIPAAVGIGLFVRWAIDAASRRDVLATGIAALAVLLIFMQVGGAAAGAVYTNHSAETNELVQYAQPADDIHPMVDRLETIAADNEGMDVLLYGEYLVDGGDASVPRKPGCAKWFNALPLPWYFQMTDSEVGCAENRSQFTANLTDHEPPVVIIKQDQAHDVRGSLNGYEEFTYRIRVRGSVMSVFVHEEYAAGLEKSPE